MEMENPVVVSGVKEMSVAVMGGLVGKETFYPGHAPVSQLCRMLPSGEMGKGYRVLSVLFLTIA